MSLRHAHKYFVYTTTAIVVDEDYRVAEVCKHFNTCRVSDNQKNWWKTKTWTRPNTSVLDRLLLPVPHSHWESGALYKLVYQQPRFEPLSSTILMRGTAV